MKGQGGASFRHASESAPGMRAMEMGEQAPHRRSPKTPVFGHRSSLEAEGVDRRPRQEYVPSSFPGESEEPLPAAGR